MSHEAQHQPPPTQKKASKNLEMMWFSIYLMSRQCEKGGCPSVLEYWEVGRRTLVMGTHLGTQATLLVLGKPIASSPQASEPHKGEMGGQEPL